MQNFLHLFAVLLITFFCFYLFWYYMRFIELRFHKHIYLSTAFLLSFISGIGYILISLPNFFLFAFMLGIAIMQYHIFSICTNKWILLLITSFIVFHLAMLRSITYFLEALVFSPQIAVSWENILFLCIVKLIAGIIYLILFFLLLPAQQIYNLLKNTRYVKLTTLFLEILSGLLLISYKSIIFVLPFFFVTYYFVFTYVKLQFITKKTDTLKRQLDIQVKHYNSLFYYLANMRTVKHNYLNHMHSLLFLLEQQDLNGARSEVISITQEIQDAASTYRQYSNHKMVDALLQNASLRCEEFDITFEAFVNLPEHVPLSDYDLCSLFSDLLEQALSMACSCKGNRFVRIKQGRMNQWLTLASENSYDNTPLNADCIFLRNEINHLITSYGGMTQFIFDSKTCTASVVLHLHI